MDYTKKNAIVGPVSLNGSWILIFQTRCNVY